MALLAGCQTPAPQTQPETLDDAVVPNTEPLSKAEPVPEPEPEPKPEPEPAKQVEPREVVESHIPEPELPEEMSFQETALARTVKQQGRGLVFAPILSGGCGIPTAIRATADEGAGYTIDSCQRAVTAAHALTYTRHPSKVGVLDVSNVSIQHDGEKVWSIFDDCVALRQDDAACSTDFIARMARTLSYVGPVLSYQVSTSEASAGGPSYGSEDGVVVDVRTGRPAKFDALIDTASILNAVKRDSFMRRAVNPVELDAAKTLDEIWKLWGTSTFAHFGGYYFAEWDAKTGQVAMRIYFLEDAAGLSPNKLKELGLWVTPKRTWRSAFEDAATKASGFLGK